jgi:hypothetical protein
LDASHFRQRAAIARELAQAGDDRRLAQMLLELAIDLDAEAEAIDAEQASAEGQRSQPPGIMANGGDRAAARIIDLTPSGMKSPAEARPGRFSAMVLPFPGRSILQEATLLPSGTDHATAARDTLSPAVPAPAQPLPADKQADACTLLTVG